MAMLVLVVKPFKIVSSSGNNPSVTAGERLPYR